MRIRAERGRIRPGRTRRFGVLGVRPLLDRQLVKEFSVLHIVLKPGAEAPTLFHRKTHEFFFVLRGGASGRIDGKRWRFKQGDYCFLPAGSLHQFTAGPAGIELLDVFGPRLDLRRPDIIRA